MTMLNSQTRHVSNKRYAIGASGNMPLAPMQQAQAAEKINQRTIMQPTHPKVYFNSSRTITACAGDGIDRALHTLSFSKAGKECRMAYGNRIDGR